MAFQTFTANTVLTAASLTGIQQLQYQGGGAAVGTAGLTVTFTASRFTNAPTVTLATSFIQASGGNPVGFVFIPYLGAPSTTTFNVMSTNNTLVFYWHAINTNI